MLSMKKKIILLAFFLLLVVAMVFFYKTIGIITIPPSESFSPSITLDYQNEVTKRLSVPGGFLLSLYATDVSGARVLAFDPAGHLIVSQTGEGKVSVFIDADKDGFAEKANTLIGDLNKPHGLAFQCQGGSCFLYVAEHDALVRYEYDYEAITAKNPQKLLDIEASRGDRHFTRTLLFLPPPENHKLLISVGSSCDVCHEEGDMRGKIIAFDTKTGKWEEYARGLRNSVFMTLDSLTEEVFATEMGRDGLGDNIPPDEVNRIEKGKNYGWPVCYGKNIQDTQFDKNTYIRNPCMEPFETPSFVDLQAHSAPLGLAFTPSSWQEGYRHNLLVAYHGSWNKSEPTGYKIVRFPLGESWNFSQEKRVFQAEDFITGWLTSDGTKIGRPVDIKFSSDGVGYISDDMNGMIYKVAPK